MAGGKRYFNRAEFIELTSDEYEALHIELGKVMGKTQIREMYPAWLERGIYIAVNFDIKKFGIEPSDHEWFLNRIGFVGKRVKKAYEDKFCLEWLSMNMIFIEVILKRYLLAVGYYSGMNKINDRATFGQLVDLCRVNGLPKDILNKLKKINKLRNSYVHGFLDKNFEYEHAFNFRPVFKDVIDELYELLDGKAEIIENMEQFDNVMTADGIQGILVVRKL